MRAVIPKRIDQATDVSADRSRRAIRGGIAWRADPDGLVGRSAIPATLYCGRARALIPPTELEIRAVAVSNTGGRRVDVRARQTIRRANRSRDTFAARSAAHVTTAYHGAARLGATSPIHACAVRAGRPVPVIGFGAAQSNIAGAREAFIRYRADDCTPACADTALAHVAACACISVVAGGPVRSVGKTANTLDAGGHLTRPPGGTVSTRAAGRFSCEAKEILVRVEADLAVRGATEIETGNIREARAIAAAVVHAAASSVSTTLASDGAVRARCRAAELLAVARAITARVVAAFRAAIRAACRATYGFVVGTTASNGRTLTGRTNLSIAALVGTDAGVATNDIRTDATMTGRRALSVGTGARAAALRCGRIDAPAWRLPIR